MSVRGGFGLTTNGALAWASGSTAYYGLGDGTFTVTVAVSDPVPALGQASGLDALVFPDTVSTGWVYERDGELTATAEYSYSFDAADTVSGTYAVTATDRATNATLIPFGVVRAVVAPAAAITATASPTAALDVSWSADDSTGAGVQDYDVEYAVEDGAWTGWFTDTQETEGSLAGQAGHAYTFRVRATDHVSNTGLWAETTVTTTLTRKYYYRACRSRRRPAGCDARRRRGILAARGPPGVRCTPWSTSFALDESRTWFWL